MFATASERCLFFMLGEQGFNNNADNYFEGWDSIVNYLDSEKTKSKKLNSNATHLAEHLPCSCSCATPFLLYRVPDFGSHAVFDHSMFLQVGYLGYYSFVQLLR
jgi:hypothetical protein